MRFGWIAENQELKAENARLRERLAELEQQAVTDPLTGLLNRRGAYPALMAAMKRSLRHDTSTSVVLLDLDHFKRVNDEHGHARGDEVLRAVGQTIIDALRATDVGIRWGGEELLVLTENDLEGARTLAERLRGRVEYLWEPAQTASFGVAEFDGRLADEPMGHTIEAADAALYRAKAGGRNRVEVSA